MKRILMIDDEPDMMLPYKIYLQKMGCMVDFAKTATEAIGFLSTQSFNLLLLDVKMSEISGFDLCKNLKQLTDAPIVFLSSMVEDTHQLQGFQSGGIDYIRKDSSLDLFWAKVNARLTQNEVPKHLISFPPLTLDSMLQQASIHEKDIFLTQSEFKLLLLLSSRPYHIWTVDSLFQALWGNVDSIHSTSVQMHLSRMRNKLEKAYPQHEFVETVWGKGYRFIPRNIS